MWLKYKNINMQEMAKSNFGLSLLSQNLNKQLKCSIQSKMIMDTKYKVHKKFINE